MNENRSLILHIHTSKLHDSSHIAAVSRHTPRDCRKPGCDRVHVQTIIRIERQSEDALMIRATHGVVAKSQSRAIGHWDRVKRRKVVDELVSCARIEGASHIEMREVSRRSTIFQHQHIGPMIVPQHTRHAASDGGHISDGLVEDRFSKRAFHWRRNVRGLLHPRAPVFEDDAATIGPKPACTVHVGRAGWCDVQQPFMRLQPADGLEPLRQILQ